MRFPYPVPSAPTIARTMDARFLNDVANDAEVRPWLGGEGPIDLTPLLRDPANVAYVGDHGGFVAQSHTNGRYEVHSMIRPAGRGPEAVALAQAALDHLFTATDATEVVTKVPEGNLAASALARAVGFSRVFTTPIALSPGVSPKTGCFALAIDRWATDSSACLDAGLWFHDAIEPIVSANFAHDDDPVHNQFAGAAVLMCRVGNARKAEWFYNRWAILAGYAPLRVLCDHPVRIDFQTLIVELGADAVEVLLCQ